MNKEIKLLLQQVQLIARDRQWNNKNFEAQSKITDANISRILNPTHYPKVRELTKESLCEGKK